MPKYSIDTDTTEQTKENNCEQCGEETDNLEQAVIAGAELTVCSSCSPSRTETDDEESDSTTRDTSDVINEVTGDGTTDSSWAEGGQNYSNSQVPYLTNDYGEKVSDARENMGLSQDELATQVGVGVDIIRIIENGQAVQSNIGKQDIESISDVLEIDIIDAEVAS